MHCSNSGDSPFHPLSAGFLRTGRIQFRCCFYGSSALPLAHIIHFFLEGPSVHRLFPVVFSTMLRSCARLATAAAAGPARAAARSTAEVPDVLVTFGTQTEKITFVSHPGVMAVSKLLEMDYLTEHRAILTQENVDAIREYDEELANKAQIAVDNNIPVNFQSLDYFDRQEFVEMHKKEEALLKKAREDVLAAPRGQYTVPSYVADYSPIEIPRKYRTDLELTEEMVKVDPALRMQTELRDIITDYLVGGKSKAAASVTGGEKKQIA
ncbi:hypothetical protein TGPRC2_297810 [Toxoplasma gondii TgCatPRC2]|uniref:Uncharacterized protein n=12 Tax=Toxoplasma gondii TaxID=5811 RepID=S7UKR8_TOXGG|nr:hypothetical protein TGME49_297810 [Toxoplasma gondii ME49]EPR58342.1 hypothetical protein TGGT1_297810 [Toxoplasma gondii GT1]KAF4645773.1 hypothetical protein TGRH88_002590 [Toxoplasma gondii]KFG40042.1 hypothetical protein TGFOU_297810 [Toxoplasma gondii FOU]KYK63332.1 hypothetical protein TGPRC2_297810 [Toxoplasma gondii TgCatPRC2]RQX67381.1 hypothetical protein TGCAST_297810 [Toxoplasma gondii CAST]|eukprot:XP_002371201.2 hypothetical protein TGME49_297810 [Toxoplasma gondii ME49]